MGPQREQKMSRTFIVASSEFLTLIRTKAFLIGVFLMPAFMGGAIVMQKTMMERPDTERREFAVVDHTGVLYEPLARAAEARNRAVTSDDGTVRAGTFVPSQVETSGRRVEDIRLELSDRIRREELFAFVEIPSAALEMGSSARLRYHSNHPAHNDLPRWLEATLGREIVQRRFEAASRSTGRWSIP